MIFDKSPLSVMIDSLANLALDCSRYAKLGETITKSSTYKPRRMKIPSFVLQM
jgi:hypothetical protein